MRTTSNSDLTNEKNQKLFMRPRKIWHCLWSYDKWTDISILKLRIIKMYK